MLPTLAQKMAATSVASASKAKAVPLLITPQALAPILSEVKVLDATWFMPNSPRNANKEWMKSPRIPGATRWDPDRIAKMGETVMHLPHMMPIPSYFARECSRRLITPDTHVVVYDTHGVFSSPRTAFTFQAYGHDKVSVLDGGLPAWREAHLPLDETTKSSPEAVLVEASDDVYPVPQLRSGWIRSYQEMLSNLSSPTNYQQVFDARPKGRFDGTAPEPRPGMSSGHIPRSQSLPFADLLETKTTALGDTYTVLKDQITLYRRLREGVPPLVDFEKLRQASSAGEPAVTATCGSGMTAAIIWLALKTLGVQASIYDESWMGWASRIREGAPVEKTKIDPSQSN